MSKFTTQLEVELVDPDAASGRGTWRLVSPLVYQSDVAKITITVPAGFVTDFASVPRIPIAFLLTGDTGSEPAVVHDYLYSTGMLLRSTCDLVLKEACLATGMPLWRAWMIYAGVRVGGANHYSAQYTTPA